MYLKALLILCASTVAVEGYHILSIVALPSKSHHFLALGIVNALLDAGHEVTLVTPFPPDKPKERLNIIDSSVTRKLFDDIDLANLEFDIICSMNLMYNISIETGSLPELRQAILTEKFDAVVTETIFFNIEAGYAAVLQVPWIVLCGSVWHPLAERLVTDVRSLPTHAVLAMNFVTPLSFIERAFNVIIHNLMIFGLWLTQGTTEWHYHQLFSELARARNVTLPPYSEASTNVSLMFVASHPSIAPPMSMPANVVEIGGYHIEDTAPPLPKDLQDLMDSSEGVVYFSMGSMLTSASLFASTKEALLRVFGDLPYTVLWKNEDKMEDLPKNVHCRRWMPQTSILAHNKTKVFITHGGMLSNLESVKYGVPLVSIPFYGDQAGNAARAAYSGYAVKVTYNPDTLADDLRVALDQVLGNEEYTKKAKYLSALFNKRPVHPRKLIVHYVQEAIETQGAYHLRSSAKLYEWYQLWMLDLLAALLVTLYIVYRIPKFTRTIVRKFTCERKNKVKRNYFFDFIVYKA